MEEVTDSERKITLWGIAIVFLLSALDQTVVSTAMPRIIADLNGLALYSWVTTAYLLSSTVMVPIWGKLSDLYGRKPILLGSIGFFLAGSWCSGLSGEFGTLPILGSGMVQLIIFRAVQGIGGGGLFTTAFAIIADLFPPQERARFGGMFGAVFGLASTLGPLIGGYFTDLRTVHFLGASIAGWRWVFYVNIPLSVLSLFMILFKMPKMSHAAKGKVDITGAFLIAVSVVTLLLALTLGGQSYPWDSPVVLGLFAGASAGVVAYIIAERYASDPILPMELFRNRVFTTTNFGGFLVSMAFMSTAAFLPLFMQLGQGIKATASGLSMLPLMVGLMGSAMLSGRLAARLGRYKSIMLGSIALLALGIFLLARMDVGTSQIDLSIRIFILGIALGPSQSLFTLALQDAMPQEQLGVVTSSSQFFRQIGSTMGVALFGTFLTNRLNSGFQKIMPGLNVGTLRGMGAKGATSALPLFVKQIVATAITDTFMMGLVIVALGGIAVLFIPDLPLSDRRAPSQSDAATVDEAPA